jgi:predicted CopG family antitoxin
MRRGKQIVVPEDVYERLAKLKVHPREPFGDVVRRLLDFYESRSRSIEIDQARSTSINLDQARSTRVEQDRLRSSLIEQDRPATPAQVEAIWNISWEISSWNDVRDVVSRLAGFPAPDDPSQLTAAQASKVIEILGRLNRRLSPKQAKEAERLLRVVAEREGLKPEEAADKHNVPLEASKLKRYHLELLKMLAGSLGSPAPAK